MVIISLELTRVNPNRNIFSINVELTSTFLLYRGLVHHHHRNLKSSNQFNSKEIYSLPLYLCGWIPPRDQVTRLVASSGSERNTQKILLYLMNIFWLAAETSKKSFILIFKISRSMIEGWTRIGRSRRKNEKQEI